MLPKDRGVALSLTTQNHYDTNIQRQIHHSTPKGPIMRKLYQCKAVLTYNYKILVEDGQNEDDVAYLCLDEIVEDSGRPKPDYINLKEIKITSNLEGNEALYSQGDTFEGLLVSDLIEEHFPAEDGQPKINPDPSQMELF